MNKFTLLYVDDEESNLRIFKNTFRRKYNIYTASSAKQGLKILNNNKIDLVLSDQRMPEMTGVEFLKYSLEKYPDPNRILITGYSDMGAIEDAINYAHIFQYIKKPWDEKKLNSVIENALKVYQLERENEKQKEDLIKSKEKAEESDRLKSSFLANMSHEIRTPMNAILGFTEILKQPNRTDKQKEYYINAIHKSGYLLLNLINDIIDISKIDANQLTVIEEEFELNTFLTNLNEIFQNQLKENVKLIIKIDLANINNFVKTDETRLHQILSNILGNAVKFTNKGIIELGYKINKETSTINFYVKDSGIGISENELQYIFNRFRQADERSTRQYGGTGLGLSIAKACTELLGGKINVQSEIGVGSTFNFTIPYKPVVKKNVSEVLPEDFNNHVNFSGKTILVVEDDPFSAEILSLYLEDSKAEIINATNGQEAVEICKQNKQINLVLMDISMPKLNGLQAINKILSLRPELPIITQTANAMYEDIKKSLDAGCVYHLSKPFNNKKLIKTISKYLL